MAYQDAELPWKSWGVDFAAARREGWSPLPFNEFVIKIHGRCNLACDYCYVYEMADQSWRTKPKAMSRDVFTRACRMIAEHATRYGLAAVNLVFHGGEPLLVGAGELGYFGRTARELLEPHTRVRLGVQTNGVLIDEDVLRVCERWKISVGVSVDGGEEENDRHRRDRRGEGSYTRVASGLRQLLSSPQRHLYSGLLCTIDLANDPVRTYEQLLRFQPPAIDFLLPHGNWSTPPPGLTPGVGTPYADWLIAAFDRWYGAAQWETQVRVFSDIMDLLLGNRVRSELVGMEPVRLAVVETDGSLEQVDELKSAFAGAAALRVADDGNALDAALWEPAIAARQLGLAALSDECRACRLQTVCGGGHYVHRYRADEGFRNPSVYCRDLTALIEHIDTRMRADLRVARDDNTR